MQTQQQSRGFRPSMVTKIEVQDNLFEAYLKITTPLHKLNQREIQVAALFLKSYFEKKNSIINDDLLNTMVLSTESKRSIRCTLQITSTYFQIILKGLKDKGFIKDGKIAPSFIPTLDENGNITFLYFIKNVKNNGTDS